MRSAHPRFLHARSVSADSGGGRQSSPPSSDSSGEGGVPSLPIDDQAPKFGQLVRVLAGGQVQLAIRDPYGWFGEGHQTRLSGEPEAWSPL